MGLHQHPTGHLPIPGRVAAPGTRHRKYAAIEAITKAAEALPAAKDLLLLICDAEDKSHTEDYAAYCEDVKDAAERYHAEAEGERDYDSRED